ncbi:MAG: acetylglutamate kinase [Eubacteriales bacterium]|jgi:acetylglutamate kinase
MENHTLREYVQLLAGDGLLTACQVEGVEDRPVLHFSCNSQDVIPGTLFLCKGAHFREQFLRDALAAGALCYVAEKPYEGVEAPCLLVKDVRRAMALLADFFHGQVWKKLQLVGITGTKGKSTTTYFVKYILDEYLKGKGKPLSGVISSIDTFDGVQNFESHITTPESIDLHRHFANAVGSGMEYMEMEVSSQALKYDRVLGVTFDVAAFLNIGLDHISAIEHADFEDYFQSKLKIFSQCRVGCVNLNSEHAQRILEAARQCPQVITFGVDTPQADVYGYQVRKEGNDILFRARTERYDREFRLTMPGLFNVQNALAAIAICEALHIPERYIYMGLMKARVSGRMEVYRNADERVTVIVDYAHNRLSFEKLFQSVAEEYPGRDIVTVFGCPGYKALDRRRDLGEISGQYSTKVIITEEDPGEEPVLDICREIAGYVKAQGCDYSIEPDRGEAIEAAIMGVERPTVILITGKGGETRQKRGTRYIDCPSDVEYTLRYLEQYDHVHNLDGGDKIRAFMDILPHLKRCSGQTILIKYGGSAMEDPRYVESALQDIAALQMVGARVILVHGGGKEISRWLTKVGIEPHFEGGYRVTDSATMEVAEMVLSAHVNKSIAHKLCDLGVQAVGVSGKDAALLTASPKRVEGHNLGQVGEIRQVEPRLLITLLEAGYLPVVSPVGQDGQGTTYNINADDAAYAIAQAMQVDKLIFLTDVEGVLVDGSNESTLIREMDAARAEELISGGFAAGGMIPKLRNCVRALRSGVGKVVVLDGRVEHCLLLEGIGQNRHGTTIVK